MEIIPKKAPQLPQQVGFLFYFSLILLIFVIVIFFIFNSIIKNSQKTLASIDAEMVKMKTPEKIALQEEILNYQKKIKDFSPLISQHLTNLEFFAFLERTTHPKVWYSKINLGSRQGTVLLSGQTESFESLGQQLLIFNTEDLVKNVSLEKVAVGKEGKIEFDLSLVLKPKIFSPTISQ